MCILIKWVNKMKNELELVNNDEQTGKTSLFDMNSGQFIQLEISIPVIETENNKKFDFSRSSIKQILLNEQLIQEDIGYFKKLLLR